jgi:hypothetical protein
MVALLDRFFVIQASRGSGHPQGVYALSPIVMHPGAQIKGPDTLVPLFNGITPPHGQIPGPVGT